MTTANLTGVRLPQPKARDGKRCRGFGESLAYVPHTGLAALAAGCGLVRFYDLGASPPPAPS
ncbi:hypothetical protein [Nonomuraea sp. NPDC002799]